MSEKKKKPTKYHFGYYYTVYRSVVRVFERLYKPVIHKKAFQSVGKPCLVFCNHGSVFDFILAGSVILPKKAVYVTTRRTNFSKPVKWVVDRSPHILRDQFSADLKSIIEMRNAIKQGLNVVLYPEGKISTCGTTNYLPKATGKLVKTFKVPVVTIVSKGNWLLKPSWASHIRKGHVEVDSELILDEKQINELSADEIQKLLEKKLSYNENKYQIENNYEFYDIKPGYDFASGLEKILYKCPCCNEEFTMKTKGDDIYCEKCGFRATYHHNGLITSENKDFTFDRIDKWFEYERESLKEEIKDENFMLQGEVDALIGDEIEAKYDSLGSGVLTLDKHKISFVSNNNVLNYNIDKVEAIPFVVGLRIYLDIDNKSYEFTFKDKLMSTKYNMAVELLAEERNAEKEKRKARREQG